MHKDDQNRTQVFTDLIKEFGIKTFVETGAWAGETPRYFKDMVEQCYTCETDPVRYQETVKLCKGMNIEVSNRDSVDFLRGLYYTNIKQPILFYLDAHHDNDWPIKGELAFISQSWPRSLVIIDDCFIREKPNFYGLNHKVTDEKLDIGLIQDNWYSGASFYGPNYDGKYVGYIVINGITEHPIKHQYLMDI